ncbi:hypothetical protein LCGC14_2982980 [marine sediment metagenome]|uniref:DUF4249 domain-containing protein n=1 Tax=marine sediment metagenome TaxID=412755 RepID=A0A0F8X6X4_9ZZZZ
MKAIILTIIILTVLSCSREIFLESDHNKSIVVNSVFKAYDEIVLQLSLTSSPLDEYEDIGENFHVLLYENDRLIFDTLTTETLLKTGIYPSPIAKYSIEVLSDNHTPIFATDSIPSLVRINEAFFNIPAGVDPYGEYYAEVNVSFNDPGDATNYYELLIYKATTDTNYWLWAGDYMIMDLVILNEGDLEYMPSSLFFSDELFNGEVCNIKVKKGGFSRAQYSKIDFNHFVELRSVSQAYYKYRKYYTRHAHNQQLEPDFLGFVYMGEPQDMYTNVSGGYGIFAGYQKTTKKLNYQPVN